MANQFKTEIAAMASKGQLESFLSRIVAANSCGAGINAARPCREACTEVEKLTLAVLKQVRRGFLGARMYFFLIV